MDITKIPNDIPVNLFPIQILKNLSTSDWSGLAFRRGWTDERLGKEIVRAGKIIFEKEQDF